MPHFSLEKGTFLAESHPNNIASDGFKKSRVILPNDEDTEPVTSLKLLRLPTISGPTKNTNLNARLIKNHLFLITPFEKAYEI